MCDKQAKASIETNPVDHNCMKHVDENQHFTEEKIEGKIISLIYVSIQMQNTDSFTPALHRRAHEEYKSRLAPTKIFNST